MTTAIVTTAQPSAGISRAVTAAATYDPIPGNVYDVLRTLIDSLAARKNQPPPKLIIAFQMSPIIPAGASSLTKRSQCESP